jgi:hypothetical protein
MPLPLRLGEEGRFLEFRLCSSSVTDVVVEFQNLATPLADEQILQFGVTESLSRDGASIASLEELFR